MLWLYSRLSQEPGAFDTMTHTDHKWTSSQFVQRKEPLRAKMRWLLQGDKEILRLSLRQVPGKPLLSRSMVYTIYSGLGILIRRYFPCRQPAPAIGMPGNTTMITKHLPVKDW